MAMANISREVLLRNRFLCSAVQQGQFVYWVKYVVFKLVREFAATLVLVSQDMAELFGEMSSDDEPEQPSEYMTQVTHLLSMPFREPTVIFLC